MVSDSKVSRIDEILAAYMQEVDAGVAADWTTLLEAFPEWEDELREFFEAEDDLERLLGVCNTQTSDSKCQGRLSAVLGLAPMALPEVEDATDMPTLPERRPRRSGVIPQDAPPVRRKNSRVPRSSISKVEATSPTPVPRRSRTSSRSWPLYVGIGSLSLTAITLALVVMLLAERSQAPADPRPLSTQASLADAGTPNHVPFFDPDVKWIPQPPDANQFRGGRLKVFDDLGPRAQHLPKFWSTVEPFSGAGCIEVLPGQVRGFAPQPIAIAARPAPGQFRFVRFAWKQSAGDGILVVLRTRKNEGFCYYAGVPDPRVPQAIEISPSLPSTWQMVTRDVYADFGPLEIASINLRPFGAGTARFDLLAFAADRLQLPEPLPIIDAASVTAAPSRPAGEALRPLARPAGGAPAFVGETKPGGKAKRERQIDRAHPILPAPGANHPGKAKSRPTGEAKPAPRET